MAFPKVLILLCFTLISKSYNFKIIGGHETTIEKRPYQASLQYLNPEGIHHRCGASIITNKHLVSAAHCDPGENLFKLYARLGSAAYNISGVLLKVETFTKHPFYHMFTADYDLAILTFEDGIEFPLGSNIAIIPMAEEGEILEDGNLCTVSGWGATADEGSPAPLVLMEVDLPVFNYDKCMDLYQFITPRHICLGGIPEGGISTCHGDSGGPAVRNGKLYGSVTAGSREGCSYPGHPNIFTSIAVLRPWIDSMISS